MKTSVMRRNERVAAVAAQGLAEDERDAKELARVAAVAAQVMAEDERDAKELARVAAVAAQVMAEDALAAALVTVSYNQAYTAYLTANGTYFDAMVAYGAMNSDVDAAGMLLAAAEAAMTAANNAMAAATNGTLAEQLQAGAAVTAAGTAVIAAKDELTQAKMTADVHALRNGDTEAVRRTSWRYGRYRYSETHGEYVVTVTVIRGATDRRAMDDVTKRGPTQPWQRMVQSRVGTRTRGDRDRIYGHRELDGEVHCRPYTAPRHGRCYQCRRRRCADLGDER